jgi:hypothetical protein
VRLTPDDVSGGELPDFVLRRCADEEVQIAADVLCLNGAPHIDIFF